MNRRGGGRRLGSVLAAGLAVAALGACSDDGPAAPSNRVQLHMTDFSIEGPEVIPAGLVEVHGVNDGSVAHQAVFIELPDGTSGDEYVQDLISDLGPTLQASEVRGGVQLVQPDGGTQTATVALEPGNYVIVCDLPGPEAGTDHLQHGMWTEVTVVGGDAGDLAAVPVDGEISLIDWAYDVPETLTSGATYRVTNDGTQTHEIGLASLIEGADSDDVVAFLTGEAPEGTPPPIMNLSGIGWLSPGDSQTFTIDVPPGRYVFACYITDPNDGLPHFMKGMVSVVEVV